MINTKLEKMIIERIGELANEIRDVMLEKSGDMGKYGDRDSGFGRVGVKLRQIERWVVALLEEN